MLGVAQYTSRLFLFRKSLTEGFLFGCMTAALYLLAIVQWTKVLKSTENISGSYAVVVLGVFAGTLIINSLKLEGTNHVSIQDITGIILVALGSALIKR